MTPTDALRQAFAAAPRRGFLPDRQRRYADLDQALQIGHGQTNSQPRTVWAMLSLLDVLPGQRILDVGCGSAWTTALLGHLVGPEGSVIGVEIVPELVAFGRANLVTQQLPNVHVVPAEPGVLGLPEEGPFDRILVSAEATRLPRALVEQLRRGGVMVVPVAGWMREVRRTAKGEPDVVRHGAYSFVPLLGG